MDERIKQEKEFDTPQAGLPVDLTKDEFVAYHMTVAKAFGTLKMQKPYLAFFGIYLLVIAVSMITVFMETGQLDWVMLLVLAITVLSGVVVLTLMPRRVKKNAEKLYEAGNTNAYYGELTVTPYAITKNLGEEEVTVPLNDRSMYLEDSGFMAFSTVGQPKAIVLPARCVTPELAKTIREAVFAPTCRMSRHVVKRMTATGTAPIARRALQEAVPVLYHADVRYEEEEVKKQLVDVNWHNYTESLPSVMLLALILGATAAMLFETIAAFAAAFVAVVIGMPLLSMMNARSKAKRLMADPAGVRMIVEINERGIAYRSVAMRMQAFMRWQTLDRAIERPDCVDFWGNKQLVRIPKRCIDDLEQLKTIVDRYHQPKSK